MRKIIHCDADCFFVAIEIRDDPRLRGLPVAVGGEPNKRGVISTCSYEARAFGVRSAMASAYAKRLCPQLIILPHSIEKYRAAAQAMKDIFQDYTDHLEPVSLDEAYLDVTSSYYCLGSATLIAKEIRRRIEKEVGITVSAGVATNKFLAKVASEWQKPNGLTVIEPSKTQLFLKTLPVKALPGLGPVGLKKLNSLGVNSCQDIQRIGEIKLVKLFGQLGKRLYQYSKGEDERVVKSTKLRKSLSVEHTFSKDVESLELCQYEMAILFHKLQKRLAELKQAKNIKSIFIKLTFNDFQKTTLEITATSYSLLSFSLLLSRAWSKSNKPVRLFGLGLRFNNQEFTDIYQLGLFNTA